MYSLKAIDDSIKTATASINGKWVPARPVNARYMTLIERLRDAWEVFRGRADAIRWPEGQ